MNKKAEDDIAALAEAKNVADVNIDSLNDA